MEDRDMSSNLDLVINKAVQQGRIDLYRAGYPRTVIESGLNARGYHLTDDWRVEKNGFYHGRFIGEARAPEHHSTIKKITGALKKF